MNQAGKSVLGGLLNRAKTLGEDTLEFSRQGLTDLMDSSSEANAKMESMLTYLDEKLAGGNPPSASRTSRPTPPNSFRWWKS